MPTFVFYKNSSKVNLYCLSAYSIVILKYSIYMYSYVLLNGEQIDELTGSNEEALRNKLKFHMK